MVKWAWYSSSMKFNAANVSSRVIPLLKQSFGTINFQLYGT